MAKTAVKDTGIKQLPLFSQYPTREDDLHARTPIAHTLTLFQQHLAKEGKSAHTVNAFTSDLQLFIEHQGDTKAIAAFTTKDLNDFLHWLEMERGVPCSRKSYARRVTTLKVYFKWVAEIAAIPHDPAGAVLQRSGQAPLSLILNEDEIAAALAFVHARRSARSAEDKPDARPALLFTLLLDTGIKKNETMRLKPDDIEPGNPPMLLVRQETVKNQYKERRISFDPAWLRLLAEYRAQYAPKAEIFACTPRNLEYVLEDISTGAGLDKKISFEMMRWTCAVRDYLRGDDPDHIREKLGLSRISWHETFSKIKRLAGEGGEGEGEDEALEMD